MLSFVAMITCSSVCGVNTGLGGKEYIKIEEHPTVK
jgi:hypothetical protein